MATRRLAAAGLLLVMVAAASGSVSQPSALRAGQIVFGQFAGEMVDEGDATVGSVTLSECVETPDGLRVTGRAQGRSELVLVLVTGGRVAGPGRAVGAGFAEDAELLVDAGPGDFTITLPWATQTSDFAVGEADLLLGQQEAMRIGRTVRCPPAKAQG